MGEASRPRIDDPRLHLATVILTIHVLGQTVLDFRISVVHIVASIGVCFLIETTRTFIREQRFVWPASALLTGSGVALILRLPDAEANAPWATEGWQLYVAVAALSLASKYVIRFRGSHVFNPSNLVLVLTFVVLGSGRVEPLDFWWAPMGPAMAFAYLVILVGGVLITRRLGLLKLAIGFWVTLAIGLGALALSGHCMTVLWDLHPVCDWHFWWVVVASPETMIFLFFMITDPRTVPSGSWSRIWFGVSVAGVSMLLMAPQTTEFGAKVGLLGGLAVCSALRPAVVLASEKDWSRQVARTLRPMWPTRLGPQPMFTTGAWLSVLTAMVLIPTTVVAGRPARSLEPTAFSESFEVEELIDPTGVLPPVDPESLPVVDVDSEVRDFDESVTDSSAQQLAAELVWLLQVENEAVISHDGDLARAVDRGRRRDEALDRIESAEATGVTTSSESRFESLRLVLVRAGQRGIRLGFETRGTRHEEDLADDALVATRDLVVEEMIVLSGSAEDRWFLFDTLPLD
jgi:hypothetical protein